LNPARCDGRSDRKERVYTAVTAVEEITDDSTDGGSGARNRRDTGPPGTHFRADARSLDSDVRPFARADRSLVRVTHSVRPPAELSTSARRERTEGIGQTTDLGIAVFAFSRDDFWLESPRIRNCRVYTRGRRLTWKCVVFESSGCRNTGRPRRFVTWRTSHEYCLVAELEPTKRSFW